MVIAAVNEPVGGLWRVNQALPGCIPAYQPTKSAMLNMDATLIETHKRSAFVWLQGVHCLPAVGLLVVRTGNDAYAEFRDGNVPAGHPQLRVCRPLWSAFRQV